MALRMPGGRALAAFAFGLVVLASGQTVHQQVRAQPAPPPIAPPGEQMSEEEIAYWESSVPCPAGPDGLQLTGASYTGNLLPSVSIACSYTDPADPATTYEITVEWMKPGSGQAYYCNDADDRTQVAVGTHDAVIRLEPFEGSDARLAALADAAAPLRDWVAGVAEECPTKIPCPTVEGFAAPGEPNAAYYQEEGSVLLFGSSTRYSSLSTAECSYSAPDVGTGATTTDKPQADWADIEAFWASATTTELDRQRPCLLEETFRDGIGTVTLGGETAAYAVYAINADEPVDPAPFEAAARALLASVAPLASSCQGVQAPPAGTDTPLPGHLAAAFDPVALGGDDEIPPATETPATTAPATTAPATTSGTTSGTTSPPAATGDRAPTPPAASETSPWYTWPLRVLGIVAMVVSIFALIAAFVQVRRETRINPRFDIARVVVTIAVAVAMMAIFSASAPVWAAVPAIAIGLALGFWQGEHLAVRRTHRGLSARRTGWAIVAFGAGIVLTQVAGYLDRAGVITLGIALSFLSAAIAAGLIVGRRPRIADAQRAAATTTVLLLLAIVGGALATVQKAEAQDDDPDVVLAEERTVGDDALIDLVDWTTIGLRSGLFVDDGKPFQVIAAPRALDTAPAPANFTTAWTHDDGSGPKQYSATETYTFELRADGRCCRVGYTGTGTTTDAAGQVSTYEAAGRLDDVQSVAIEGSTTAPARMEAVGVPFTEVQNFADPATAAADAPATANPDTCRRIVGESRSPFDLDETGGLGEFTTYLVDGQPQTPPENELRVRMVTDCAIEGFTNEAGLAIAPPAPPVGDPSREGGCPVFQELIADVAPANRLPGVDTQTTAQVFLAPNSPACSANVTLGQAGPGETRHELVYSLARPSDIAYGTESTWVDEGYWNDLPLPYEFPAETTCAVDANGIPVAPADPATGCNLMTRHVVGDARVAIWTDWETLDGPNVLVFVTAPWGSYAYRCHHCTPTDPAIAEFLAAVNGFAAGGADQIAAVSGTAPSSSDGVEPDSDATTDGPGSTTTGETDETGETGDDDEGGLEEAPIAGLVGLAGALALYGISRAEGEGEGAGEGEEAEGEGEGEGEGEEESTSREVPSWVDDPRPLSEIWAEQAAAEAQRHGGDLTWDPERNALVERGYQSPEQLEQLQRDGRDRWRQLTTTLEGAPGLTDVAAFLRDAEVHVVLPDGTIDLAALQRVEQAADRLGQLALGAQRVHDYTDADAAWDTIGQAADNPLVRVGASILLSPAVDPFLQTLAMANRSEHMVEAGMTDDEIEAAITDELVLYGGLSVAGAAGGQLISANAGWLRNAAGSGARQLLAQLPDDAANALSRSGQRTLNTLEQLGHAGATNVTDAWERGLNGTWRHAGNVTRISQLTAANQTLGTAVDDLYQQIDRVGPSRVLSSPTQGLNPLEQRALDLLRSDPAGYRQAVRSGLVPPEVHRTVNWARDRIVRQAISQSIDDLGPGSGLTRIDFTGTGANPLGARATSGWTDVDLTALGSEPSQTAFTQRFTQNLDGAFGTPDAAGALDVTCFAGRSGSPAGFTDPRLLNWVEIEAHYTGRSVRVTDSGLAIFGYQPGATLQAPPPRLGPGLAAPAARDDIQRLVTSHTIDTPVSVLDDLRANGKYAQRIWKVENVGSGLPTPEGIKVLEQIKADRRWVPSAEQLAAAERAYNEFTGLTAGRTS